MEIHEALRAVKLPVVFIARGGDGKVARDAEGPERALQGSALRHSREAELRQKRKGLADGGSVQPQHRRGAPGQVGARLAFKNAARGGERVPGAVSQSERKAAFRRSARLQRQRAQRGDRRVGEKPFFLPGEDRRGDPPALRAGGEIEAAGAVRRETHPELPERPAR